MDAPEANQNVGPSGPWWASFQDGIEDAHGRVGITGLVHVVSRGNLATREIGGRVRGGEPGRELAELGSGSRGAAVDRQGGRLLERGGDVRVSHFHREG